MSTVLLCNYGVLELRAGELERDPSLTLSTPTAAQTPLAWAFACALPLSYLTHSWILGWWWLSPPVLLHLLGYCGFSWVSVVGDRVSLCVVSLAWSVLHIPGCPQTQLLPASASSVLGLKVGTT